MPLFEYQCKACDAQFEQLVFDRDKRVTCKVCGSAKVVQLLSTFSVATSVSSGRAAAQESGPCGACGAPERGTCGSIN